MAVDKIEAAKGDNGVFLCTRIFSTLPQMSAHLERIQKAVGNHGTDGVCTTNKESGLWGRWDPQ